jgi:type IV pilus assembly protein PilB
VEDKRTLGQILVSMGRISEQDVARALQHQRDNGGYFGEALLACELVTEDELEFGLASQFDLPYVFPEADAIDPEAAAIVSPEWALAHLTLPIMMTDDTLTVVVESPLKTRAVDELRARTDRKVALALASASNIRELIRQVYARAAAVDEERRAPIDLTALLDEALEVGSIRFGISVRGIRSSAWWDDRGTIRRRPLGGDWHNELERMLVPGLVRKTAGKLRAEWDAEMNRAGIVTALTVQYLADESGSELLFKLRPVAAALTERFSPPAAGVLSEVRLLARSGTARFIVTTVPESLGHEILPHLPTLLLDPSWRSIYLNAEDRAPAGEAFSVMLPRDPEKWAEELETLRAFHFDVVTVDLSGGGPLWAQQTLDVASVAFLLWRGEDDARPAYDAGIRWRLHIAATEGGGLEWSLDPLHA